MTEKITMTGTYQTKSGLRARILCTDRKSQYPVVALITDPSGTETVNNYTPTGNYWSSGQFHSIDLIPYDPLAQFRTLVTDAPVWLKVNDDWHPRHFAGIKGDWVMLYLDGKTSHSSKGTTNAWGPSYVSVTKPKDA